MALDCQERLRAFDLTWRTEPSVRGLIIKVWDGCAYPR